MTQEKNEWPIIRKDLVDKVDLMVDTLDGLTTVLKEKEKSSASINITMQKNIQSHQDALYGFMNDKGEWVKGLVQLVGDGEERRKKMDKSLGWAFYGMLTAIGVSLWDTIIKFGKFVTGHA